jgi:hypothetical protein
MVWESARTIAVDDTRRDGTDEHSVMPAGFTALGSFSAVPKLLLMASSFLSVGNIYIDIDKERGLGRIP